MPFSKMVPFFSIFLLPIFLLIFPSVICLNNQIMTNDGIEFLNDTLVGYNTSWSNSGNIFLNRGKRAIRLEPYRQINGNPPLNGQSGWPIINGGDNHEFHNDRLIFYEVIKENTRMPIPGGPQEYATAMPGVVEVIEWGISRLELMTCLATTRWNNDKLQSSKPMVEIRAKHHTFYYNHREVERCATTYTYKQVPENEPGLERDPEMRPFMGEHENTRIRFLYTGTGTGIEEEMASSSNSSGNEPPAPKQLQRCCSMVGKIQHEFLHAIGYIHEHQRPDRNNYVWVHQLKGCPTQPRQWIEMPPNYCDLKEDYMDMKVERFRIPEKPVDTFAQPYDYGSVMHFGQLPLEQAKKSTDESEEGTSTSSSFGDNLLTDLREGRSDVIAINRLFQQTIGQRYMVSFQDIKRLNLKHCLGEKRHCSPNYHGNCKYGGYLNPSVYLVPEPYQHFDMNIRYQHFDMNIRSGVDTTSLKRSKPCTQCICPDGFAGAECEMRSANTNKYINDEGKVVRLNLFGTTCDRALEKHFVDAKDPSSYRKERSRGQKEDHHIGIDSEGLRRGEIKFPPPPNDQDPNDPAWRTELYVDIPWRRDPISCYWWIYPKNVFEKIGLKLGEVNLPCMYPCHSYVEIKYKRDKSLTGARFCCPYSLQMETTVRRRGPKRDADGEIIPDPDMERQAFSIDERKDVPKEYPEIVADNGVPVIVIFRLNPDWDLLKDEDKLKHFEKPGFQLRFWTVTADQELFYDLSYQTNRYHLSRNARGELDPEDPIREGRGFWAGGSPYQFENQGFLPPDMSYTRYWKNN